MKINESTYINELLESRCDFGCEGLIEKLASCFLTTTVSEELTDKTLNGNLEVVFHQA